MSFNNTTFQLFSQHLGNSDVADFIGERGEIFYDPNTGILKLSDGINPGGISITSGAGGSFDPSLYYTRAAVDGKFTQLIGSADTQSDTLGELQVKVDDKLGLAGGTLRGPVYYAPLPTGTNELTNKNYVDQKVSTSITTSLATLTTDYVAEGSLNKYFTDTRADANFALNVAQPLKTQGLVRKVNGIAPDSTGGISISLTTTVTGDLASQPASADDGTLYVIVNDADANNDGRSFVWANTSSEWVELAPSDTAANDARYINVAGDTMTGNLTLASNPTTPLHAATKQYVDTAVSAIAFALDDLSDANTATATVGQSLVYNGTNWVPATPAAKLGDLTDVSNTAPGTGYILGWDSANSEWKPIASSASPTLASLLDVDITGVANNSTLQYSAATTEWKVTTPQPKKATMFADHGVGWGRSHVYGNEVFCAGFAESGDRIHAWNHSGHVRRSISAPFEVRPPGIAKLVEGISYQHVLGTDGILYSRGRDAEGQMGTNASPGRPIDDRGGIFRQNRDPKVYGPGISVINVWSHRVHNWDGGDGGSLWVEVNDNGTKKLYAAGYNGNGVLGVGGIANAGALTSLSILDGKGIKKLDCVHTLMCLITNDGELHAAGYNNNGALALDFIGNTSIARAKYADGTFVTNAINVQVSWVNGTGTQSWFLRGDGTVWGSGLNTESNLGIGVSTNVTKYNQVLTAASTPITGVVKIREVGRGQLFMLKSDGTVWATGRNHDSCFGNSAFTPNTNIGNFARQIQSDIQDFWSVGGAAPGWCTVYWKKNDKMFFSGTNANFTGGSFTEALGGNYYNFLQPIETFDGKTVVDVKPFNKINDDQTGNYRSTMFLTDDGEIYVSGFSNYCHVINDADGIYLKTPYKLTDYLEGATETVYVSKTETDLPTGASNGQVLTYNGTEWIAKTFVPDTLTTVTKVTGQWTLNPGLNNVSFTVPFNQVVNAFVLGNIPNGIVTYDGTFIVTNGNVNAVGNQYAWSYTLAGDAHALELVSIPDQIVGTSGTILRTAGTFGGGRIDANVLKFTINNKTASPQTVNYGYVPLS